MPMLEVENLNSYYVKIHALKDVSITVEKGEIVTIIGANGAGKSTMLRTTSGLLKPRSGSIRLEGEELGRLTVKENLEMGAFASSDSHRNQENMERVFTLFPRLKERSKQLAGTLSGGEQQMLAMGRALMSNPRVLLLDEPSMGLAPVLVDSIFDTIRRLHDAGTTILLVEQNARMALQVANRGYVLQSGTILMSDTAEKLADNEMVRKAYLGEG
jgi:branched-chain amino acid transport system ATP-binding protein